MIPQDKVIIINNRYLTICTLTIFALAILSVPITSADGMEGFTSNNFSNETLNLNDGKIDDAWSNVTSNQVLTEYGDNGSAKFANNGTHLFALLTASFTYEWISVEFESEVGQCMRNGHDGWTIYLDQSTNDVNVLDISFVGSVIPFTDSKNDLQSEYVITGDLVEIEIVRPFDTDDTDGSDIVYKNSSLVLVSFASNVDHYDTRDSFYLFIQYYEGIEDGIIPIDIIPDLNIPVVVDWLPVKTIILQISVFFIGFFISVHFLVRVIRRPLYHGSRIVDEDFKAPTFIQRWNSIINRKSTGEDSK